MVWLWKDLSRLNKLCIILISPVLIDRLFSLSNNKEFCKATPWAPLSPHMDFIFGEWTCPVGTVELYRDLKWGMLESRFCCHPSNENYNKSRFNAANKCRTTSCQLPSTTDNDPCSSLNARYINVGTTKLAYEEIARESCTIDKVNEGVIALCCVRNSTESYLSSMIRAEPHEFPHMAELVIQFKDGPSHLCGGTIYNRKFIITAAHCLTYELGGMTLRPEAISIRLGSNIALIDGHEYIYPVRRLITHPYFGRITNAPPKFSFINPNPTSVCPAKKVNANLGVLSDDIGLVELDRDIEFGRNVWALEIAPKEFHPLMHADSAVILGWGINAYTNDMSMYLKNFNFRILGDQLCFQGYYASFVGLGLEDQQLCLGGQVNGWIQLAGKGDSGGPAICRGPHGRAVLCGIASTGGNLMECVKEGYCLPNTYTEVAHYHDWIKDIAGEQELETLYQPHLFGENIEPHQQQHQVHITSLFGKPCGGTLIAHDLVLTLVSCVLAPGPHSCLLFELLVEVGHGDQRQTQTFTVVGVSIHPGCKGTDNPNDNLCLAIIKLGGSVTFPISYPRLPRKGDQFDGEIGRAMAFPTIPTFSWGKMTMQQREFHILSRSNCQERIDLARKSVKLEGVELCGVEKYSGGFKCDWELGGGVLCRDAGGEGPDILCGVQYSHACEFSVVALFMNMTHYSEWVLAVVEQLSG